MGPFGDLLLSKHLASSLQTHKWAYGFLLVIAKYAEKEEEKQTNREEKEKQ